MTFANIINSRALDHEGAMVDVYSKMKPDSLGSQLQTILTAYYEDIKGVVSPSSCTKPKVVKHKFEDQDNAEAAAADADANATDANAATPATQLDGGAEAAPGGEGPPQGGY